MPISTRPTRPKHFRTAIFVLSLLSSEHVCAEGVTPVSSTACGVRVDAPANVVLRADTDAPQPLCVLRTEAGAASPFVNTVVTMPFSRLDQLRVDGVALREISFFHIAHGNVTCRGRPSYQDERNAYAQRVVRKAMQTLTTGPGGIRRLSARTELKVNWLKPATGGNLDETEETYVCFDSAAWTREQLLVLNWCVEKGNPLADSIETMARSLMHSTP